MARNQHPARFSPSLIEAMEPLLNGAPAIHDPFGGTGERLGHLADRLGLTFTGTELEPEYIVDHRVVQGNALDYGTYPLYDHWIVTSPVYPNGMADNFKPRDASRRYTYRAAKITLSGDPDAELHPDNMGRFSYRGGDKATMEYWSLARAAIERWSGASAVLLNVSDFIMGGQVQPVVVAWNEAMARGGWRRRG